MIKKLIPTRKNHLSQIDIIALGKGKARKRSKKNTYQHIGEIMRKKVYIFDENMSIKTLPMTYDEADKILLKARDEAHRFANAYRKKQMSKELKK